MRWIWFHACSTDIQKISYQQRSYDPVIVLMADHSNNLFAAQIALPDEETIRLIERGYNVAQVAAAMHSDINLVALKVGELARRGYTFSVPEYKIDFMK